ncbi:MAG: hypothetical protein H7245_15790 [Candidatus Saccharibacteria bacterium]|nr:hypothetical protein [Pseudorhodobacter sp.]
MTVRAARLLVAVYLSFASGGAYGQVLIQPVYSIWDVVLGQSVTQIPEPDISELACGTNGGPPAHTLDQFEDFAQCQPEGSGLREVTFIYDDEQDYIARALELEYKFLQGGTSIFAHPVVVSVLVDPAGLVQGLRIVTDNRISDRERRTAVTLMRNFKARFHDWALDCRDIPMKHGEQPVGNQFSHEVCTGTSADGRLRIAIEASYLRKKGQTAVNLETQAVNSGYFESQTRFEQMLAPYDPTVSP